MGINYGDNTKKINLKKYSLKIKKFLKNLILKLFLNLEEQ